MRECLLAPGLAPFSHWAELGRGYPCEPDAWRPPGWCSHCSVRACRKGLCCDLVQPSPVLGFSVPNAMLWNGDFLVRICPRLTESGALRIGWGWSLLIWPTSPGEHFEGSSGTGVTFANMTISIPGNFLVPLGNELASLCLLVNFTFISIHCSSLCSLGRT